MDVDRAVERILGAAVDEVEELLAVEDAAGVLGEGVQEVELEAGEAQRGAGEGRSQGAGLEEEVADAQGPTAATRVAPGAADDGADAGEQLARGEGLGDVVVGAGLEAEDAVGLLVAGGQHEHGQVGARAQLPAHREAVEVGEHEVEEDGVVGGSQRLLQAGEAVVFAVDGDAVAGEVLRGQLREAEVVLDEEDPEVVETGVVHGGAGEYDRAACEEVFRVVPWTPMHDPYGRAPHLLSPCVALLLGACGGPQAAPAHAPSVAPAPAPQSQPGEAIAGYVVAAFTDSKGVLWFGTMGKGVARHDGEQLTYLSPAGGKGENVVASIAEDRHGDLWFAGHAGTGLVQYDGTTFTQIWEEETRVTADRRGNIWAGTRRAVFRAEGDRFTEFVVPLGDDVRARGLIPGTARTSEGRCGSASPAGSSASRARASCTWPSMGRGSRGAAMLLKPDVFRRR